MFPMMRLEVDAAPVLTYLKQLYSSSGMAAQWMGWQFEVQAREIIAGIFSSEMGDIHPLYQAHIMQAIMTQPLIVITPMGPGVQASVDLNELGTMEDLEKGMHRWAIDTEGNRIELPYGPEAGELKNETEIRYSYWQAIVSGASEYLTSTGVYIPMPTGADYESTLEDRIRVWGDKAPEWLLLYYGIDYEPAVEARPIVELVDGALGELWLQLGEEAIAQIAGQRGIAPDFSFDRAMRPRHTVPGEGNRWVPRFG